MVGMSGGVDSSVTAALLKEQGYEVVGVYLDAWDKGGCETNKERQDALKVAKLLGIPFKVIDVKKEYKKRVIDYFFDTYRRGLTPNPDILCNSEIKFGIFYDWAMKQGFEAVATGHYARIISHLLLASSLLPKWLVQRGKDLKKDQSYFLWKVVPERLKRIIWPLGEMKKEEVRTKAHELRLPVADKPDSMGVCFVGDVDVREMLRERLGEEEGKVVMRMKNRTADRLRNTSSEGSVPPLSDFSRSLTGDQVIGRHKGLWFYTIGQRGGFEIDKKRLKKLGFQPEKMKPLYVVGKDVSNNILFVGEREECFSSQFTIHSSQLYVSEEKFEEMVRRGEIWVRVRNLGKLYSVFSIQYSVLGIEVIVKDRIFGVASGQSAVFYWRWNGKEGEEVIVGGGEISL